MIGAAKVLLCSTIVSQEARRFLTYEELARVCDDLIATDFRSGRLPAYW
jgi:hypothetical protein